MNGLPGRAAVCRKTAMPRLAAKKGGRVTAPQGTPAPGRGEEEGRGHGREWQEVAAGDRLEGGGLAQQGDRAAGDERRRQRRREGKTGRLGCGEGHYPAHGGAPDGAQR